MFVCDIAAFGDRRRTDEARTHMRHVLYASLEHGFDKGGVPFEECYREDRGDGAMLAVPPQADTGLLLSSVVDLLRAEVRRHNDFSNEAAQLRLRVAVHTGAAHSDGNGLVGTAVNHTFRILDATPFKDVLRDSGAHLALAVSQRVYEDVVRHGRGLVDPADYRRIEVQVKETSDTAWVRVPGMRLPGTAPGGAVVAPNGSPAVPPRRAPRPRTANQILFELVDLMLDIPVMAMERNREQVVRMLAPEIAGVIPRHGEARADTLAILRTCLDYSDGLPELLMAIRGFTGDSVPMRRLEQAVDDLTAGP
ncbi:hypothetical protein DPM19_22545 [Actinomadura craniellae]|uniref:Effector-associated domain-containing protein n=2 Tax=Actinomadura craniellae TaxID=2231787 RepID=A0A365H137_9ACTN|nr:hypothetical protein DPM19_22545 [Actinomadura craniellae]